MVSETGISSRAKINEPGLRLFFTQLRKSGVSVEEAERLLQLHDPQLERKVGDPELALQSPAMRMIGKVWYRIDQAAMVAGYHEGDMEGRMQYGQYRFLYPYATTRSGVMYFGEATLGALASPDVQGLRLDRGGYAEKLAHIYAEVALGQPYQDGLYEMQSLLESTIFPQAGMVRKS